jgi:hypothetical protein
MAVIATGAACQTRSPVLAHAQETSPPAGLWDDKIAETVVGKTVLIGLTRSAHGETPVRYEQLHGVIESADRNRGFRVALEGKRTGEDYWLPPQTTNFIAAEPGVYRLRSTGEEVENPDYISNWTIDAPTP